MQFCPPNGIRFFLFAFYYLRGKCVAIRTNVLTASAFGQLVIAASHIRLDPKLAETWTPITETFLDAKHGQTSRGDQKSSGTSASDAHALMTRTPSNSPFHLKPTCRVQKETKPRRGVSVGSLRSRLLPCRARSRSLRGGRKPVFPSPLPRRPRTRTTDAYEAAVPASPCSRRCHVVAASPTPRLGPARMRARVVSVLKRAAGLISC